MNPPKVLVVGASGLVGTAAALAFIQSGWQVVAASRRAPALLRSERCTAISLDLTDAQACTAAVRQLSDITHVVYTAVYELRGLIAGWSDPEQISTNDTMLKNLMEPLCQVANLQQVTLLQGTKAYGAAVTPMRVPARESQPRVAHANFYWQQQDYLSAKATTEAFAYTILRPQLIVGPNHGVVMNLPPVIGVYAAMRAFENLAFAYPGGADWVWEATDVRLVGNACVWAATQPIAEGQIYNLTNGEVFMWRDMWPAIAATLGVETGPDEPMSIAAYLDDRAHLWPEIVQHYQLQPLTLPEILGESHHYADLCFATGARSAPAPTFVSTVKIKQAGFTQTFNSEASFCHWLDDLRARKVLPDLR